MSKVRSRKADEEALLPGLGEEGNAAADGYAALLEVVRLNADAQSSGEALEALFRYLNRCHGVLAVALEVSSGPITRLQPYGDINALVSADDAHTNYRLCICPLNDAAAPPGQLTFVLASDSPLTGEFLQAVTAQVALRVGQETLVRRAEEAELKAGQRISEVATIYEIGQAIDQIELPRLLQLITYRAAALMEAQACSLMLMTETGTLRVAASHGLPDDAQEQEQKLGEGIAGRVAQTEQPMLIVGEIRDPRLAGVALRPDISSSMLVPMKSQEGKVLGVLAIRRRHPAAEFNDDDLKLFSVFATQAALALTNVQLYDDLKRRASELAKISTLSRALISTLDLDALMERIADDIRTVVGFERCCLFIREKGAYVPRVWRGYPDTIGRNPVREGEGAIGAAAKHKTMLLFDARETVSPERERERLYLQMKGFARSLGTNAFVAVPILMSEERCLGVVVADNKARREPITAEQRNLLSAFVAQVGVALENARLYEEMQENYRNIHRLKNYTDNVLQSIGAGIISTDTRGHIARWNHAAEETLHLSTKEFRDASLFSVLQQTQLPEAEYEHLVQCFRRVLETGERVNLHKLTLHPRERLPMTLNLILSRLVDHNHERAGVVMIFEDVTQEVRLEAEVEKMRRLADIGQLAAKMAHEVRNALSPIKGAAQIIRVEMEGQNSSTEWPDIIIAEVDGLSRLTSEMLDFARPTQLDPRNLIVSEFLTGAVQSLGTFLTECQVTVRWDLPDDLPILSADPVQLGQVVRNIVMNAAQAMPEGGEIAIKAEYDEPARLLAMRFRDGGAGIAESELDRIFRPFVTTKTKGTGLGLPIVQKIVDHHGGRVEVQSRLGEGTCFTVLLPLRPPEDSIEVGIEEIPLISARHAGLYPDRQN